VGNGGNVEVRKKWWLIGWDNDKTMNDFMNKLKSGMLCERGVHLIQYVFNWQPAMILLSCIAFLSLTSTFALYHWIQKVWWMMININYIINQQPMMLRP